MTDDIVRKNFSFRYACTYHYALHCGDFIDVSHAARPLGFEFRVGVSLVVWLRYVQWDTMDTLHHKLYLSEATRLHDLLIAAKTLFASDDMHEQRFSVSTISRLEDTRDPAPVAFMCILAMYSDGEAVITIVLPEEC